MVDANRVTLKSIENYRKNGGSHVEKANKSAFPYMSKGSGIFSNFLYPERLKSISS
jgi:hypothetical protein